MMFPGGKDAKTKLRTLFSVFCALVFLLCGTPVSSAVDQDISDMYPSATTSQGPEYIQQVVLEEQGTVLDRFSFDGFVDIQQGYDNNVELDPQRLEDGFLQLSANGEISYEFSEAFYGRAGVDTFNIIYYKYNVNNLADVAPYLGFDWALTPDVVWKNRVVYDYFSYPNQKESSYNGLVLTSYLRHYLLRDFYHEFGAEYLKRWYPDRKISLTTGARDRLDRADDKYRIKYTLGLYGKRFFARLSNEISVNDSNDAYQDYYDYRLYRVRPSIMYFFTDKFYTDLSFIYRHTWYKDRRNTEDVSEKVRDNTYITTASLYYDLTSSLTLGLTYSYVENTSNDPFQKYSGSTLTGGVFYSF
ncbi:MAG: hypothetical protein GF408_05325 [Candidatus Omnitrophica bacterium]|nr:hypothetical protein [Candidatus Omnitrophota bacterium]